MTFSDLQKSGIEILTEAGIADASYDSRILLEEVFGIDRTFYLLNMQKDADECKCNEYLEKIKRRANHIPLQHILGYSYFYGHKFLVNENVLVPRHDTEVLVEAVLKVCSKDAKVLDMCTGSGCIILTLAKEGNIRSGVGIDVSEDAIEVANANKESLRCENVSLIKSDLFDGLSDEKFDIVVSNPPYIRTDVIESLDEEVKVHDPFIALDGHEDGLFFYKKITENVGKYLKKDGYLFYEIGHDQAKEVSEILEKNGFRDIKVLKDLAGLDRVVSGRFS